MANECELLVELEPAVSFKCATGTGIEKGALLILTDPSTVATTTGDTDEIIGVAAEEHIANVGATIGVYLRGIFKGTSGAAGVTAGLALISDTGTGAANDIVVADVNSEAVLGISFDTVTDGQTFRFLLQPVNYNLA